MTRKENRIQFIKFTFFSISAGGIQAGSFALLDMIPTWSYSPKYLIAISLSVLWNFTLNRRFTFKSANNIPVAMFKIAIFYLIFIPVTTIGGDAIVELGVNQYLVLGTTMVLNFILEFLYQSICMYKNQMNTRVKKGEKYENN